jgi:G3E family GTPase
MSETRLPLTVIGGYLGAGKTTLINRLLRENHGQKVMVMVNDFGSINIDADLLESSDGDTMTLTNGCVCCTMGADLFMAMGDMLDRHPRPDHLVIEASGIADPSRIANAAKAEPEMSYGGIAVVVDAINFPQLAADPQIGAQIRGQVSTADLVLVSKTDGTIAPALRTQLATLTAAPQVDLNAGGDVAPLLLGGITPGIAKPVPPLHPAYLGWSHTGAESFTLEALRTKLGDTPKGLYRVKGYVCSDDGPGWEVHVVGHTAEIKQAPTRETRIVAIGAAKGLTKHDIADWWHQKNSTKNQSNRNLNA